MIAINEFKIGLDILIILFIILIVLMTRLKKRNTKHILTYRELLELPIKTNVIALEYGSNVKQHGTICIENNIKKVNVYDGVLEFTEADIWLDNES